MVDILKHFHIVECEGHFGACQTTTKVLQLGFYWPNWLKDVHALIITYDRYQNSGNISR
jgi:hypothetical protein